MFPAFELYYGGGTYALMFTESGNISIRKIKPINQLLFYVPDMGVFQLNKDNRLIFGKSQVYIFDQKAINSLNIQALVNISDFLKEEKRAKLDDREIAYLVETVGMKVTEAKIIQNMIQSGLLPDTEEFWNYLIKRDDPATSKEELQILQKQQDQKVLEMLNDLRNRINFVVSRDEIKLRQNLSKETIDWLNNYYTVDTMADINVWLKVFENSAFKMKASGKKYPFWIWQRTVISPHIALVIIDNRILEVDASIKVKVEIEKGKAVTYIDSKKYGRFKVADPKTIYRYGKTRVYVVSVQTVEKVMPKAVGMITQ